MTVDFRGRREDTNTYITLAVSQILCATSHILTNLHNDPMRKGLLYHYSPFYS